MDALSFNQAVNLSLSVVKRSIKMTNLDPGAPFFTKGPLKSASQGPLSSPLGAQEGPEGSPEPC